MYIYPKNILTPEQLLQKLIDADMTINSVDEAKNAIYSIGYYRLKGYFFHFYNTTTHKYQTGTNFNDILKLYQFDSDLSLLIFGFLSKIEVALRARLTEALLIHNDALILNDPSIFENKNYYWKNQSSVATEIARSSDVFIKYNFQQHEGAIPLWASVEVLSFGTLSKIIKSMKTGAGSAFSCMVNHYKYTSANGRFVTPSKDMFTSWIQSTSVLRNICAHNSRIYNRSLNTRPELISTDMIVPTPRYTGLYQVMLAMKYLRPSLSEWNEFVTSFNELLQKYNGVYELNRLGFPLDWASHF